MRRTQNCLASVPQTFHPLATKPLKPKGDTVFQIHAFFGVCFQRSGTIQSHYRLMYVFSNETQVTPTPPGHHHPLV